MGASSSASTHVQNVQNVNSVMTTDNLLDKNNSIHSTLDFISKSVLIPTEPITNLQSDLTVLQNDENLKKYIKDPKSTQLTDVEIGKLKDLIGAEKEVDKEKLSPDEVKSKYGAQFTELIKSAGAFIVDNKEVIIDAITHSQSKSGGAQSSNMNLLLMIVGVILLIIGLIWYINTSGSFHMISYYKRSKYY